MHKEYPYLQDSYIYQTDIEWEKRNILSILYKLKYV